MVCILLRLTCVTQHYVDEVHPYCVHLWIIPFPCCIVLFYKSTMIYLYISLFSVYIYTFLCSVCFWLYEWENKYVHFCWVYTQNWDFLVIACMQWALVDTAKQLFKIVDAVNTPTGNV